MKSKFTKIFFIALLLIAPIFADETSDAIATLQDNINIVWTCVAAFLVFFMQAGFAMC